MTSIYRITTIDTDGPMSWQDHCMTVCPGEQDSGRCNYRVTTADGAELEAALEADDSVIRYSAD